MKPQGTLMPGCSLMIKDGMKPMCCVARSSSLVGMAHSAAKALEQLCRYINRPALANERVQTNATRQVVLKLKSAWRDGTTHVVARHFGPSGAAGNREDSHAPGIAAECAATT